MKTICCVVVSHVRTVECWQQGRSSANQVQLAWRSSLSQDMHPYFACSRKGHLLLWICHLGPVKPA